MQFQPKTEEQLERDNLLEEGRYPFTIKKSEEADDKEGRGFFKLKLFVHGPESRDWHVFDNVSPHWMAHKLRHLCFAVGLGAAYERGSLNAKALEERQGYCEVGIQPGKNGYPAKNVVVDYEVPEAQKAGSQEAKAKENTKREADDDVPF